MRAPGEPNDNSPAPTPPGRLQFGIWHMLVLLTASAVILALVMALKAPDYVTIPVAVYFVGLAAYAALRALPNLQYVLALRKHRRTVRKEEAEMAAKAAEQLREARAGRDRQDGAPDV